MVVERRGGAAARGKGGGPVCGTGVTEGILFNSIEIQNIETIMGWWKMIFQFICPYPVLPIQPSPYSSTIELGT
jgi:hypothetical protein